jgi:hypothetical protein
VRLLIPVRSGLGGRIIYDVLPHRSNRALCHSVASNRQSTVDNEVSLEQLAAILRSQFENEFKVFFSCVVIGVYT